MATQEPSFLTLMTTLSETMLQYATSVSVFIAAVWAFSALREHRKVRGFDPVVL